MIRFGPAGIPLSCKGRTLKDGIEDVSNLSLTALEIQMVRARAEPIPPDEDYIGQTIKDIDDMFVVEILRDDEPIDDPDEPIDEDDLIVVMPSGITESFGELAPVGKMAKRMDVSLSIHTPYYMDLGSNNDHTAICMDYIRHAGKIVDALDGEMVVTNLGLYNGSHPDEEIDDNILNNVACLMEWWQDSGLKPKLGVEITGQSSVFGSVEQVLDLCDQIDGIVPVINFPHHHARTSGSLMDVSDFADLIEMVAPYYRRYDSSIHTTFAGVERDADGNERRLTPIKKGDLKFEPLAEALADIRPDLTIISSSPLLEHDAMYMKIIHERVLTKRAAKTLKARKKEESANTASAGE